MLKIATWNICLGFKNKKDYIYKTLNANEVMICALQELELPKDCNVQLLSSLKYKIESENTSNKARIVIVVHNSVNYEGKTNLEVKDSWR